MSITNRTKKLQKEQGIENCMGQFEIGISKEMYARLRRSVAVNVPHTLARVALTSINDTGGFSLNADLVPPISGYMVSRKGMELRTNPAIGNLEAYIERYLPMVQESSLYFGGWIDETDQEKTLYLDVSENILDRDVALRLAFSRGQLAIYDVEKQETIYLPK